jgi:hypothetical protein
MLQVQTTAAKGESSAYFTIRLPRFGSLEILNSKMVGKVQSLLGRCVSPLIEYGLNLVVDRPENQFNFVLSDPFASSVKMESLTRRLREHFQNVVRHFEAAEVVPLLWFDDTTNPRHPRFKLRLPPRTAIYSTNPLFWEVLLMPKYDDKEGVQIKTRTETAKFQVFGYWNFSSEDTITINGKRGHYPGVKFTDILDGLQNPEDPPAAVQVTVEFFNPIEKTLVSNGEHVVERLKMSQMIDLLLRQTSTYCNFNLDNLVSVSIVGQNTIRISNTILSNTTRIVLRVTLNEPVTRALGWPKNFPLRFPLNVATQYDFNFTEPSSDIFAGLYPVTVLLEGYGEAKHYIEGRGYSSVLGVLRENQPPMWEPVIFETDYYNMRISFVDFASKLISFVNKSELNMIMHFETMEPANC